MRSLFLLPLLLTPLSLQAQVLSEDQLVMPRPGATAPIVLEDVPVTMPPIATEPSYDTPGAPIEGMPIFEWADEDPNAVTNTTQQPMTPPDDFIPVPPAPEAPYTTPAIAADEDAPFTFQDSPTPQLEPEVVQTPEPMPMQTPNPTYAAPTSGPVLTVLPGSRVQAYRNMGGEMRLTLPENTGSVTLVLYAAEGAGWFIAGERNTKVDGILLVGPGAKQADIQVQTYVREQAPVLRRSDLGEQNAQQGLSVQMPLTFQ